MVDDVLADKTLAPVSALRKGVDLPFSYEIVRSPRRKSACIEIKNAKVVLRAPMRLAESTLLAFAASKAHWVLQKLDEQQQKLAAYPELAGASQLRSYETGVCLPFMGEELRLVVQAGRFNAVMRQENELWIVVSNRGKASLNDKVRALIARWYADQALIIMRDKTLALTASLGLSVSAITIKATRSKWGHCTSRGAIQYNWQILLAPEAVVDYLVAHEVSHLLHHNHSPAFWAQVQQICPEFRALKLWLKQQGATLVI